jgi:hypothetical protein
MTYDEKTLWRRRAYLSKLIESGAPVLSIAHAFNSLKEVAPPEETAALRASLVVAFPDFTKALAYMQWEVFLKLMHLCTWPGTDSQYCEKPCEPRSGDLCAEHEAAFQASEAEVDAFLATDEGKKFAEDIAANMESP